MKTNPIYAKAKRENGGKAVRIDLVDTAKLIRANLKREFPGVKFSVRSDRYAGGASIRVKWIDGPLESDVNAVVKQFGGKGFDGMIDMAYYHNAWLLPDGSAAFRDNGGGTVGSAGCVPAATGEAPDGAIPVHFGADYVFADQGLSVEGVEAMLADYAGRFGDPLADAIKRGDVEAAGEDGHAYAKGASQVRVDNDWGDAALWRFRNRPELYEAA